MHKLTTKQGKSQQEAGRPLMPWLTENRTLMLCGALAALAAGLRLTVGGF